jgi:hypothetical protein
MNFDPSEIIKTFFGNRNRIILTITGMALFIYIFFPDVANFVIGEITRFFNTVILPIFLVCFVYLYFTNQLPWQKGGRKK